MEVEVEVDFGGVCFYSWNLTSEKKPARRFVRRSMAVPASHLHARDMQYSESFHAPIASTLRTRSFVHKFVHPPGFVSGKLQSRETEGQRTARPPDYRCWADNLTG